jgi:two-component system, NarL family, invasion response regulator UvrY
MLQAPDPATDRPQEAWRDTMSKVLIVDDHAVVRAGLRQFLEADRNITQIGEAGTGAETADRLREERWDLVILDINLPDRSGIDVLRDARLQYPSTPVLIMSGFPEKQYAVNVMRAGASGFVAKDGAPEDLLRAVRTVLSGRRFVSGALADLLVNDLDAPANGPLHARLSQREFQVMCKLAVGRQVSDIAGELSISVKTVSTYRARVLEKMGLSNNAELTAYALRNNLIQ